MFISKSSAALVNAVKTAPRQKPYVDMWGSFKGYEVRVCRLDVEDAAMVASFLDFKLRHVPALFTWGLMGAVDQHSKYVKMEGHDAFVAIVDTKVVGQALVSPAPKDQSYESLRRVIKHIPDDAQLAEARVCANPSNADNNIEAMLYHAMRVSAAQNYKVLVSDGSAPSVKRVVLNLGGRVTDDGWACLPTEARWFASMSSTVNKQNPSRPPSK